MKKAGREPFSFKSEVSSGRVKVGEFDLLEEGKVPWENIIRNQFCMNPRHIQRVPMQKVFCGISYTSLVNCSEQSADCEVNLPLLLVLLRK